MVVSIGHVCHHLLQNPEASDIKRLQEMSGIGLKTPEDDLLLSAELNDLQSLVALQIFLLFKSSKIFYDLSEQMQKYFLRFLLCSSVVGQRNKYFMID